MNIRLDGLLLLLVILGSAVAVPAFAQTANNTFTPTNTTMSSQGQSQYQGPAYTIANMTASSTTAAVTVVTDKPSYNDGDTVKISGTTANYLGDTPLTLILRNPVGNIVKVDQITVGSDKTFSSSAVATGALWISAGTYTISVQYGSPSDTATTTFQFSGSSPTPSGPSTIPVDGTSYSISYTITNGKVTDIKADPASKSLTVSIQTTGDGLLTITMPRALIDATNSDGSIAKFVVLNDGQENTQANETMTTSTDRTLAIPFKNGTQQIEIIGTFVIPEFGPIAVAVLAIAVVSIIAISKKTGLRFAPKY
ncbi:MAG: PEFG-CTERM sorting domain-containing protein [Nitrosotalea sp.]